MAEHTQSPCSTTQLTGCPIKQYKGHPQDSSQVLPFQQWLLSNDGSNLEVRKKRKKKEKNNCYRQSKITPRARACPLAPSLKSERKRWDKKGNRQLHSVVSSNHPLFCSSPALTPQRWLQAATGISNTLVPLPLLTGVPRHWQWFVQNASVYGNTFCVQRLWAAQPRLLQGRGRSSDLTDPIESASAEWRAGETPGSVWTSPILPSLCIYQVNTDHNKQKHAGTKQLSSTPCQARTHTTWIWKG